MKKQWFFIFCVSLVLSFTIDGRAIAIKAGSDYKIVVPDEVSSPVDYASKELQKFINEATAVNLPIVHEGAAGTSPAIHVGPTQQSTRVILKETLDQLAPDGVVIKTVGPNLFLRGNNDRAEIYSVYEFLEKYLNVRFLAEDCSVVPKTEMLKLPAMIDYAYAPPFYYRDIYSAVSFPRKISLRHRLNGNNNKLDADVGGKTVFSVPPTHSFFTWVSPKKYFANHPEYFSLKKGKRSYDVEGSQLCLSNPDVLKIVIENVLKYIQENPSVQIIDISQQDYNVPGCECENCQQIVCEEGSEAGPILRFVNAVAEEVAKKYPDKKIATLAYNYSTTPPRLTKPRENVIIRLCHRGCYFHGLACHQKEIPAENYYELEKRYQRRSKVKATTRDDLDGWSKIASDIFIWHYGANFTNYLTPNQNMDALVEDIRYYAKHSVKGLFIQCDPHYGGEMAALKGYLMAQLLWDPTRDSKVIKKEFCAGYYGSAASDVFDFVRLIDSQPSLHSDIHVFCYWDPQNTVTPSFCKESLRILNKAGAKVKDDPTLSNRVDMLLLSFWCMQLAYPERYGLEASDAAVLLEQVTDVVQKNRITHRGESAIPGNVMEWIKARKAYFNQLAEAKLDLAGEKAN